MSAVATQGAMRAGQAAAGAFRFADGWPFAVAIVALGVAQQAVGHFNGDNSWFILFAERVIDGARAYVEIGDPNPPAAFLVYAPAAVVARALGLATEAMVVVEVFALAALTLALSGAVLRRTGLLAPGEEGLWRNAALWIALVAPGFGFAEREHFALMFALPMLAVAAARADGRAVSISHAVLAGVCAGITLCFKPYYAAGFAAAALVVVARRRSPAPLFAWENIVALATGLCYLAFVARFFPEYYTLALPVALDVYAPARLGFAASVLSAPLLAGAAVLCATAWSWGRRGFDARAHVLMAASAGFLLTFVVQGKGWFNHAYPGLALALFCALAAWLALRRAAPERAAFFAKACVAPAFVCAPFFGAAWMNALGAEEYPGLTAQVRALAPARPKIAALAAQLDVAHPLTRRVNGVWIGRQNALWVANCVAQILATQTVSPERRALLESHAARERADFAADFSAGRPDVLLVESAALREWAGRQPEFGKLFDGYARAGQAGAVEIWTRESGADDRKD